MQIKTVEALTMKDAMKVIKKELGPDAVLLSSREKEIPGKEQKYIEVTAASFQAPEPSERSHVTHGLAHDREIQEINRHLSRIDERLAQSSFTAIDAGISDIKAIALELLESHAKKDLKIPSYFTKVYYQLRIMGVAENSVLSMLNRLRKDEKLKASIDEGAEAAETYAREFAIRTVYGQIKIQSGIQPEADRLGIHCFIGAPGAGKSSMIAKLAGARKYKEKNDVSIVSYQTSRLGADESLRLYSKIIGCRFQTSTNITDLRESLSHASPGSIVFIDTPGISSKSRIDEDLLQLSKSPLPIEFHLVASLTEKNQQIDRTIAKASKLGLESLCFTKLDEAQTFGEIYNQCIKWSIPLSYFATGEDVPDDIEKATRERVIQKIFGIS